MQDDVEAPRVLVVTHHLPWPITSGGRRREAELLTRLAGRFDIELLAVSKVPNEDFASLHEATELGIQARVFPAHPHTATQNLSPHEARHNSPAVRAYLASRAHPWPAVVHVEGHYLAHLLPERLWRSTLLVEHNIESTLFEQRAAQAIDPQERSRLYRHAELTRRAERTAWRSVRSLAVVTDDDAEHVRRVASDLEVHILPNGADHLVRAASPGGGGGRQLTYVGNFAYQPNEDAARLLVSDILPAVARQRPDVRLTIVGHSPPGWLVDVGRSDPRVTVTGWVPDVVPFLDAADVVICPLEIGGGVKVKILEALVRGCAIVTTPVGAQGLEGLAPGALATCGSTDDLIETCLRLLNSPAERHRQQRRALLAAKALPTWDDAAIGLARMWTSLALSRRGALGSVAEA